MKICKVKSGFYEFIGEFRYLSNQIISGVDYEKLGRNVIVFDLLLISK